MKCTFLINKICIGKNEQELNFNVRCNNYKGQLFENNPELQVESGNKKRD